MRTSNTCPKCSGRKLVVAGPRYSNEHGWFLIPVIPEGSRGYYESWTCAACGYTEFYAMALSDVDEIAAQYPDVVRIVESGEPSRGPYR
jgi:predicted nucleic-acid-binding Zn-ribbon protein